MVVVVSYYRCELHGGKSLLSLRLSSITRSHRIVGEKSWQQIKKITLYCSTRGNMRQHCWLVTTHLTSTINISIKFIHLWNISSRLFVSACAVNLALQWLRAQSVVSTWHAPNRVIIMSRLYCAFCKEIHSYIEANFFKIVRWIPEIIWTIQYWLHWRLQELIPHNHDYLIRDCT